LEQHGLHNRAWPINGQARARGHQYVGGIGLARRGCSSRISGQLPQYALQRQLRWRRPMPMHCTHTTAPAFPAMSAPRLTAGLGVNHTGKRLNVLSMRFELGTQDVLCALRARDAQPEIALGTALEREREERAAATFADDPPRAGKHGGIVAREA
jgi:hypothetical protein